MRKVTVHVDLLCDWPHESPTPAVVEHTITLDRGKPRIVAACETHLPLVKELAEVLHKADYAEQAGKQKPSAPLPSAPPGEDGKVPCGICGTRVKPGQGIYLHARRTHGMTKDAYLAAIATQTQ